MLTDCKSVGPLLAPLVASGLSSVYAQDETIDQPLLSQRSTIPEATPLGQRFDFSNGAPATDPFDALTSGRLTLRSRLRYWYAAEDGFDTANAFTLSTKLGYLTNTFAGIQGFVEGNHVEAFTEDQYFDGVNGRTNRALVADTEQTELNQAWGQFSYATTSADLNLRAGRQAASVIDERFIGNVSSRQGEQTYDAMALGLNFGSERRLSFEYGYIDRVNRIFGDDDLDYESDSHALRFGYNSERLGNIAAIALLLDLDAEDLSNQTYGVSVDQRIFDPQRFEAVYTFAYAYQESYADNPVSYEASSWYADFGYHIPRLGIVSAGFERNTSDGGDASFQFSLTTGQRVHRISDKFLTTPDDGLQDYFLYGQFFYLPVFDYGEVNYHYYTDEEKGHSFGQEINVTLSKNLSPNVSASAVGSYFDSGDPAFPDLVIANLEIAFKF